MCKKLRDLLWSIHFKLSDIWYMLNCPEWWYNFLRYRIYGEKDRVLQLTPEEFATHLKENRLIK